MRESIIETLIGIAVVAAAAAFFWYANSTGGDAATGEEKYEVTASFNNISGVSRGTDVRLAGVKIGTVQSLELDPKLYEAKLVLTVDSNVPLPYDTSARISTDGLLGGAYIALEPGGDPENIETDGSGIIDYTRGSVDLLTLFASFASGGGGDSDNSSANATGSGDDVDFPDLGDGE